MWKRKKSSLTLGNCSLSAPGVRPGLFFACLFLITLALRLCHAGLLWPDEDYHLAAAIQTLHGKLLYRDLWYDKPPLNALLYAAIGAPYGWTLRLFDSVYVLAICWALACFARELWGEVEALFAAGAMAFFLNFDLPVAIIPIAPDLFMMLPHVLAVYSAWRGRALAAGLWCGIAFLFNTKALFVLVVCSVLAWPALPLLLLGFLVPCLLLAPVWAGYVEQVWKWGLAYASASLNTHPLRRIADWLGFHVALIIAAVCFWCKQRSRTSALLAIWAAVSLAAILIGGRVFPRYFLQLLPVVVLAAARGMALLIERRRKLVIALIAACLLIPLIRFGPRYVLLALNRDPGWRDVTLDQDSRAAATWINANKQPGDTILIWGYRPDIVVYTRLPYGSRFPDSQPLTGVPADRHLFDSTSVVPDLAARNRQQLLASAPTFIVDGLGPLNPRLSITAYADLSSWLAQYHLVHKTPLTVIYRRAASQAAAGSQPAHARPVHISCATNPIPRVHLANLWTAKLHLN